MIQYENIFLSSKTSAVLRASSASGFRNLAVERTYSYPKFPALCGRRVEGIDYMVTHHIVVQHKLNEHCVQRFVSSTHFSKLLFSVLSTPRLSLVSFYVLLCT